MENRHSVTVYLVDDDQMFLEALQHYLSEGGPHEIKTRTFSTGEACLEELHHNPDAVILDFYLNSADPNAMNGIEVLKRIKSSKPHIPVIMLSAQDNIEVAMETMKHGAFDYVSKSESALVKIKNILSNMASSTASTTRLNKKLSLYRTINIAIIVILILLFIVSRII